MGFFSKILEKLGIKKDKPAEAAATPAAATPATAKPAATGFATPTSSAKQVGKDDMVQRAAPAAISEVDVVANLEKMAAANPAQLNWKVSIVDLLKLLDLDSSFDSRKELATELGCPAEMMNDSAKMNTWLHKEVLKQIAANGGNIPKELLD
jgi:hypothetical protein